MISGGYWRTWKIADKVRIGPAINFVSGDDRKKGGKVVQDSGLMRLSAGGEIYYGRNSLARVSLAAYKDVLTHNTNEGVLVNLNIVTFRTETGYGTENCLDAARRRM